MKFISTSSLVPAIAKFSGATLNRVDGGWTNNKGLAPAGHVYSSLFEAIAGMFAGYFTILDMAQHFGLKKNKDLPLGLICSENPAAALEYIRWSWMNHIVRYHPRSSTRPKKKPTDILEKEIDALHSLMGIISSSGHLELYASLKEAVEQYQILLGLDEENWTRA